MADLIKLKPVAPAALNPSFYVSKLCARHPTHQQSPGVCSVCVNEKLARLSTSNSSSVARGSCSSSLSDVSSECSSPGNVRVRYSNSGSLSFVKQREKDEEVLSKSRSMAAAVVRRVTGGGRKEMMSGGFWSKVVKRTKKKKMEH